MSDAPAPAPRPSVGDTAKAVLLVALAGREGSAASVVFASLGITGDNLEGSIRFAREISRA